MPQMTWPTAHVSHGDAADDDAADGDAADDDAADDAAEVPLDARTRASCAYGTVDSVRHA